MNNINELRKENTLVDLFCTLAEIPSPSLKEEKVIDKDSFVQIDNIIQLEHFSKLETKRRQIDKLSDKKFKKVLDKYLEYKENEWIDDNKKVFMSKEEIISLNEDLK